MLSAAASVAAVSNGRVTGPTASTASPIAGAGNCPSAHAPGALRSLTDTPSARGKQDASLTADCRRCGADFEGLEGIWRGSERAWITESNIVGPSAGSLILCPGPYQGDIAPRPERTRYLFPERSPPIPMLSIPHLPVSLHPSTHPPHV